MVFSSLIFIFVFLPATLTAYYAAHKAEPGGVRLQNAVLLAASMVFYAWSGVIYLIRLLVIILLNYLLTLAMARCGQKNSSGSASMMKKLLFLLIVVLDIGNLMFYKYLGFFAESAIRLGTVLQIPALAGLPMPAVALPVGISFYTFQILSYAADVYRNKVEAQKNPADLALYVIMFPQLIAGPIVRYSDINRELGSRRILPEDVEYGIRRFILGFFKKVFIANLMGGMADTVFDTVGFQNTVYGWLGILSYTLQIYYDFSAYSDMAIGIGRMFGFHFNENFLLPYRSESITEFWRRWHVSLSSWFRDYVYIPLGGNRKGTARTYLNLFIVFLLTGFWHGAAWHYIIWGLFNGFFLIAERLGFGKVLKKLPRPLRHIYTILVVMTGYVFFRAGSTGEALRALQGLFTFSLEHYRRHQIIGQLTPLYLAMLPLAIVCSVTGFRLPGSIRSGCPAVLVRIWYLLVFALCVLYLSGLSYNPFIYFKF